MLYDMDSKYFITITIRKYVEFSDVAVYVGLPPSSFLNNVNVHIAI